MNIIWSPRALERVVEIGEFIVAQDRPNAAADWVEGVFACRAPRPASAQWKRMVPERRRDDLREVIYGAYRVIYRLDSDQVVILTVRHSRLPIVPGDPDLD